jgi:outer membrane protein OmpA-like peptidoglycan-associated protein
MTIRPARSRATISRRRNPAGRARSPVAGRSRPRVSGGAGHRPQPASRGAWYRPRPASRGAGRRLPAAPIGTGAWPWKLLGVLLAAGAIAAAVALCIRARGQECPAARDEIISASQVTQDEGDSPSPPAGLVRRADQLAACGGQLVLVRGAGQGGVLAGPVRSLRIYREPGELENDPTARDNKVQQLVTQAFRSAQAARVPGAGRDVIGLLATVSSELGPGRNDVWLRTLGLPTVNPADARVLMATDPAQAVTSIPGPLPSLHGTRVHLILSPPAGNQPRFNPATDAWRRLFMVDLLRRLGADVVSVTEDDALESPAQDAEPAPVVANLPDPTPRPPATPRPHRTYTAKLDSSAVFLPDLARFTTSDARVLAELRPIINGWRRGLYSHVTVVGHCARFGPAGTAVLLSQHRAAAVARLLRLHGVTAVTATGTGYSQPLPPDPASATNRVVIVTAYPKN